MAFFFFRSMILRENLKTLLCALQIKHTKCSIPWYYTINNTFVNFPSKLSNHICRYLSTPKALSHVAPLRNYFLREENYRNIKRPPGDQMFLLVQRFGELLRKLWNPRNFKAHVSPHEMLQAVVLLSKKRFQITEQGLYQSVWSSAIHLEFVFSNKSSSWCYFYLSCYNRVQWLRGRALDSQLGEPVCESCAALNIGNFFQHCLNLLNSMNEYLAIDSGEYCTRSFRELIAEKLRWCLIEQVYQGSRV